MRMLLRSMCVAAAVALAGCGESGDRAIAYGDGLGQDWRPPAGGKQMRVSVENYFTRDVVVVAEAPGRRFELTVGPIRKRYMIIPEDQYQISAFTEERSTGLNYLYVSPDDRNGAKGLWVKIRF